MSIQSPAITADVQRPPKRRGSEFARVGSAARDPHRAAADLPVVRGTAEVLVVFLIAVAARLPSLGHLPYKDELTHVLAARSLLETGTLEIVPGTGSYSRGWGFTYLVAGMFRVFGESLVVGRIPALVFGALLVTVLFLWVRSEAGRIGAWFAAMLLAFSPLSLDLSQWVRFYTLYALLFLIACLLVYRLFSRPAVGPRQGVALTFGALVILYTVEELTGTGTIVVGLAGLGLWVTVIGVRQLFRVIPSPRARVWLAAGLLALAAAAAGIAFEIGFVDRLMFGAAYVPLWGQENQDNYLYYHDILLKQYPALWILLPLAALVAARSRPHAALLCVCVFGVAFLAHSIAASKAERYLFYALPMFFALWGIAVGRAVPWVRGRLQNTFTVTNGPFSLRVYEAVGIISLAALVLYPAVARPALKYGLNMLKTGEAQWTGWVGPRDRPDVLAAGTALARMVTEADAVLGSHDVTTLYALGRIDYFMRRFESPSRGLVPEFETGGRLKIPVVSSPQSLSRIMACNATGLVFMERGDARREVFGLPALVEYLDVHALKVELPEEWGMIVYRWERSGSAPAAAECETLPR